ncbi:ER membrane protein complex subunit 1 [Madurella fahalii]|uniref:ER membrane protein complex subunit 1 n=1 Tax=Madurella fahalii TaxID=1157608 RepID=A0ABQ0G1J8_9PEZI
MHLLRLPNLLLLPALATLSLLPAPAAAVFRDEVGHIDYHRALLGLPQRETTFFHRPRRDDRASLLYTLSDVGVLGAVNPGSGEVVWRQDVRDPLVSTHGGAGSFARAGEGEGWVVSALGRAVHAWDAVSGRNKFWVGVGGVVRDLEVMEMTEQDGGRRKDVLVLFEEDGSEGATVLRRLNPEDGAVVWEFRAVTRDVPLQVSTNVEKVFVVSLKGAPGAYNLKVSVLDTLTGKRLDEMVLGAKADVHGKEDVMFVGANSAAPIVAWTDDAKQVLRVNVLGTKNRQEFPLPPETVAVEIHAPHLVQSQPHFLVHSKTAAGHKGDVYHIDLKTNTISKAYSLPLLPGPGSFSTSSSGANVYFTRITKDEVILLSSQSHGVLGRWPLTTGDVAIHGVSEVIKKAGSDESYAVRAAAVTDQDDWVLVRNGGFIWSRPEGMSGGVAATFAEIPESEALAKSLEQEAHSNPLAAYVHRVRRHINDLQYLPAYLNSVPWRVMSSILGTDVPSNTGKLVRDSFGFRKLVVLATKRGMLYCLDAGNNGNILWRKRAFEIPKGRKWDVKGIRADESTGQVTIIGSNNDLVVLKTDTGDIVESNAPSSEATTQSTALVDTPSGQQLIRIGRDGKIGDLPAAQTPSQTVVTRSAEGELKGVIFIANGTSSYEVTSWAFSLPQNQRVVSIATRPPHDVVASIGRVLGDRGVKYKYLNPNTLVLAAVDDTARALTVYLLDTVSGHILSSSKYDGVDTSKPIECAMAENWFVCSFFGQYTLRENSAQTLKGYQIVVSDLYESEEPNDRGPLGDAATFSSLDPIDVPTGVVLPSVVSQSYVLSAPISALQVTQTRQGISSRQVLAYLPETHGIAGIPRMVLEPRRPAGRDPTPAEVEEGLIKYHPAIEIDPKSVITHERDVLGVEKIITSPAVVESTSLVFAYGIDVFGTRVAPSFLFDILGKGFNKVTLVGTVLALLAGVSMLAPVVKRKQTNMRWEAPM